MANEKRLIDANEAYEIARLHHKDFALSMVDLTSLREVLEDAPTVDAVEVVRCKDCEYCDKAFDNYWCNYNWNPYAIPNKPKRTVADGFCHNGERRPDNG